MKQKKQQTSTAKRIKALQQKRLKGTMFVSLIVTTVLLCLGFFYVTGSTYIENGNIREVFSEVSGKLSFSESSNLMPRLNYTMTSSFMEPKSLDITSFSYSFIGGILLLWLLNMLIASCSGAFAKKQIQRQLQPIYDIAKKTIQLSDENDPQKSHGKLFEDDAIHDLESAIDSI